MKQDFIRCTFLDCFQGLNNQIYSYIYRDIIQNALPNSILECKVDPIQTDNQDIICITIVHSTQRGPSFSLHTRILVFGHRILVKTWRDGHSSREAHFAKILCDVAHSKILLCATSHKIFAKWASDVPTPNPDGMRRIRPMRERGGGE